MRNTINKEHTQLTGADGSCVTEKHILMLLYTSSVMFLGSSGVSGLSTSYSYSLPPAACVQLATTNYLASRFVRSSAISLQRLFLLCWWFANGCPPPLPMPSVYNTVTIPQNCHTASERAAECILLVCSALKRPCGRNQRQRSTFVIRH